MSNGIVLSAKFVKGVTDPNQIADLELPEVALIGRSNVGKSSLINQLTNQNKLARVSKTPGRTKEINLFELAVKYNNAKVDLYLADLPGFGYAKVSRDERAGFARLIFNYLTKPKAPGFVFILNDSKRLPEDEELAVRDICADNEIHYAVILTKCDRLTKRELSDQSKKIADGYNLQVHDLLYSARDLSTAPIWERCLGVL